MQTTPSLKALINHILARFNDPKTPELTQFVSGVNDTGQHGSIDDGSYGDPHTDARPAFIQKDNDGWASLNSSQR